MRAVQHNIPVFRSLSLFSHKKKKKRRTTALTDIGKLAVLKDHKVVLLGQRRELIHQILIKVVHHIDVSLSTWRRQKLKTIGSLLA